MSKLERCYERCDDSIQFTPESDPEGLIEQAFNYCYDRCDEEHAAGKEPPGSINESIAGALMNQEGES